MIEEDMNIFIYLSNECFLMQVHIECYSHHLEEFSYSYRVASRVLVSEPCSTVIVLYLERGDPLFLITAALNLYGGKLVRHVHVHFEPL